MKLQWVDGWSAKKVESNATWLKLVGTKLGNIYQQGKETICTSLTPNVSLGVNLHPRVHFRYIFAPCQCNVKNSPADRLAGCLQTKQIVQKTQFSKEAFPCLLLHKKIR